MFPQPTFPPVWQDPRGSAAGGSLEPSYVLAFQKHQNKSSQNWLFSQAIPRFIEYLLVVPAAGRHAEVESGSLAAVQTFPSVLEGFKNTSRFRDETRSNNSPKKLATPEGNSQLGSNCPNSKAPKKALATCS